VGSKRKLNDETGTVNVQTDTDLTAVTHMGAVGTLIPIMGVDANAQQIPPVVNEYANSSIHGG
jgi:hypothetical protein